jgi:hypothetical protein
LIDWARSRETRRKRLFESDFVIMAMPDIKEPEAVTLVKGRLEGRGQDNNGKGAPDQPPKKVAQAYEEVDRSKPADDSITILGIPIEQITSVTHAALSGLVAENNFLRNALSRYERGARRDAQGGGQQKGHEDSSAQLLDHSSFVGALGAAIAQTPGKDASWVLILVHLKTYETLRRSSGLLAANGALDDVGHRFTQARVGGSVLESAAPIETSILSTPAETPASLVGQDASPVRLTLAGRVGGSTIAGLVALPIDAMDTTVIARSVRDHICESGFHVGGVDMALEIQVAAAACGVGESPLLALGRADQLMRAG